MTGEDPTVPGSAHLASEPVPILFSSPFEYYRGLKY